VTIPKPCRPLSPSISLFFSGTRVVLLGFFLSAICLSQPHPGEASVPENKPEKPYALIFGTVWGPDNRPVYGVRVKIRRAKERKVRWELYSDHHGEFAQRLPAGREDYLVWADLKGYKSIGTKKLEPGTEVPVHIENDERTDISLHLK
jgi:hypothetical protein